MGETPNHGYNVPEAGTENWNEPLNENFEQYDTDIEIRDRDGAKSDYRPKEGAKFFATDTGQTYIGNGSEWDKLSQSGAVYQQRSLPEDTELNEGEGMVFISDGSSRHTAGDLVYAVKLGGTISTNTITTIKSGSTIVDGFEDGATTGWDPSPELTSTFEASNVRSRSGSWSARFAEGGASDSPKWENVGEISQPTKVETAHALENGELYSDTFTEWTVDGNTILRVNYNWSNGFLAVNGSGASPRDIEDGAVVADLPWPSSDSFFHVILDNIDWESNEVGEVKVNGTLQTESVPFLNDADGIDRTAISIGGNGGNIAFIDDTTVPE